jgi:hypothetical protein
MNYKFYETKKINIKRIINFNKKNKLTLKSMHTTKQIEPIKQKWYTSL